MCHQEQRQGVTSSLIQRDQTLRPWRCVCLRDPLGSLLTGQRHQLSGFYKDTGATRWESEMEPSKRNTKQAALDKKKKKKMVLVFCRRPFFTTFRALRLPGKNKRNRAKTRADFSALHFTGRHCDERASELQDQTDGDQTWRLATEAQRPTGVC